MSLHKGNVLNPVQKTLNASSGTLVFDVNNSRIYMKIVNDDAAIKVYAGYTSSVSSTTGHVIKPGTELTLEAYTGPVYVVAASGTPVVTAVEW